MASTRIQLSDKELEILEAVLAPVVSDSSDIKLLIKIQRALVSVGGKVGGINQVIKPSNNEKDEISEILARVLDGSVTDNDRVRYFELTGMEI